MKQIACIFGCILLSLTASAQDTKVGIKAGSNQSTMNFSLSGVSKETDPRISFHAGFYATIMTSKKFGIQPELMYSGLGGTSSTGNINLSYLSVPLMFRYNFLPWLSLQAGPQLSILLNATDGSADIGSQFTTMDVGGAVGVGVDLPLKFIFSFRYVAGFTNVSTVDFSSLGLPDPSVTNKVIQFSLGYTLSRR